MNIRDGIKESMRKLEEQRAAMVRRKAPQGVIDSVDKRIQFARELLRKDGKNDDASDDGNK